MKLEMFFEKFEQFVNAPNAVVKLRELVLQLAVQGNLVPQDSNDEPASELLKKIASEKVRLVGEGKGKKAKPLPEVVKDEIPYSLPLGWEWTRLGVVTNFGQTDKADGISNETWVLDLEDIEKDTSVILRKVRFLERPAKSDKNIFLEGDVLYGKLRPYLNKVIIADEAGVCTTEILPVRGYFGIVPSYLMYALKRPDFLDYVNSKSYGMKMPRLGTNDGQMALFPLPPLSEQQRIVTKIDQLMALVDKLEEQLAASRAIAERLMAAMVAELTTQT